MRQQPGGAELANEHMSYYGNTSHKAPFNGEARGFELLIVKSLFLFLKRGSWHLYPFLMLAPSSASS